MKIHLTVNTDKHEYEIDMEMNSIDEAVKILTDNEPVWTSLVIVICNEKETKNA
jgi:hypothetical protein